MSSRQLSLINKKGKRTIEPSWFTVVVGGKQPDGSKEIQNGRFEITGKHILLEK